MTKALTAGLILMLLAAWLPGCASPSREQKTRCPKCGSFFDTKEGEEMFRYMQGR
jgi:hypothetical protein